MVMAMVVRPLIPMEGKKQKNIDRSRFAAPDYETFQELMKKANEISGVDNLKISYADTSEFDRLLLENERKEKKRKHRDSDIKLLQNVTVKKIISPQDVLFGIRQQRSSSSSTSSNSRITLTFNEEALQYDLMYDDWEKFICWEEPDYDSINAKEVQEASSQYCRRIIQDNSLVSNGSWVKGIIWDASEDGGVGGINSLEDYKLIKTLSDTVHFHYENDIYMQKFPQHKVGLQDDDEGEDAAKNLNKLPPFSGEFANANGDFEIQLFYRAPNEENEGIGDGEKGAVPNAPALTKEEKLEQMEQKKMERLKRVLDSTTIQKMAEVKKTPAQDNALQSVAALAIAAQKKKLTASAVAEHSYIAASHLNIRNTLRPAELKNFHRPRLTKSALRSAWSLFTERKSSKHKMSQRHGNIRGASHLASQITRVSDLAIYDGDFVCVEYVEERPLVMLNVGMASKIVNYYRAMPEDENKSPTDHDNLHSSGDMERSGNSMDALSFNKKLPRHLQYLNQKKDHKGLNSRAGANRYKLHDVAGGIDLPKLPEGVTEILEPDEEFPMLGDIEPGARPQPCLLNSLYRAPMFPHQGSSTDFLLVRFSLKRGGFTFLIRPLPFVYLCGQQEPQMIVPKPTKQRKMTPAQMNLVLLNLYRYFNERKELFVDNSEIEREFAYYVERFRPEFKKCINQIADSYPPEKWKRKSQQDLQLTIDELERRFECEDVCLNDAMICAIYRLNDVGINQFIDTTKLEFALTRMQKLRDYRIRRCNNIEKMASTLSHTNRGKVLQRLSVILKNGIEHIKKKIDVARYIHEQLILAPWNLTEAFVRCQLEKSGFGLLQLTGVPGDPSGIGEGFSFLKRTKDGYSCMKADAIIGKTEKDLRKLTSKELDRMLIQMGMDAQEVKNLERWDKVFVIREMANVAADEGISQSLHRFARTQKLTQQGLLEEYKRQSILIWRRQALALSQEEPPADDADDSDDNDEWATIEEDIIKKSTNANKEDDDNREYKTIQTGEFFENLVDDPGKDKVGNAAAATAGATINVSLGGDQPAQPSMPWIRPHRVVKRIKKTIKSDGTEVIEVQFIVSPEEVDRVEKESMKAKKAVRAPPTKRKSISTAEEEADEPNMTLKIGVIKNKVKKHEAEKAKEMERRRSEELMELTSYIEKSRGQKSSNNSRRSEVPRHRRLPHVLYASSLEKILMEIWNKPMAEPFKYPVDTLKYPAYLTIVSKPMCFSDIRNKIAKYEYFSVNSFLADLELVAKNAELFNGAQSPIAKHANMLYKEAKKYIQIDKEKYAHMQDKFTIQEADIRAKFNSLHRPYHGEGAGDKTSVARTIVPNLSAPAFLSSSQPSAGDKSNKVEQGPNIAQQASYESTDLLTFLDGDSSGDEEILDQS